jgi:hypothetical protein
VQLLNVELVTVRLPDEWIAPPSYVVAVQLLNVELVTVTSPLE